MIDAVNLTVERPTLKKNIMYEFHAESSQDLKEALQQQEPGETADKFQKSLERTERDLLKHRKEISQQAEGYQRSAVWMGLLGMGVIVVGALLVFFNITPLAVLSGVASIVSEAISVLFITRATQASKLVDRNYEELQEIYKADQLVSICDTIEMMSKREDAKTLVIEKLAGKWFN